MKRLGLIVVVAAVAVVLYRPATGQDNHEERISSLETRVTALEDGSVGTPIAGSVTITGWVTYGDIGGESIVPSGIRCSVDLSAGGQVPMDGQPVTVRDEADTVIGASQLYPGVFAPGVEYACVFGFRIDALPPAAFYSIKVGSLAPVSISADALAQVGYAVAIEVGEAVDVNDYLFLTQTAPTPEA